MPHVNTSENVLGIQLANIREWWIFESIPIAFDLFMITHLTTFKIKYGLKQLTPNKNQSSFQSGVDSGYNIYILLHFRLNLYRLLQNEMSYCKLSYMKQINLPMAPYKDHWSKYFSLASESYYRIPTQFAVKINHSNGHTFSIQHEFPQKCVSFQLIIWYFTFQRLMFLFW